MSSGATASNFHSTSTSTMRSKRPRPQRRGYVLLMTLVLLVVAVLSEAGLARRSLQLALDAKEAQDDLQRRWAAASCRRLLLDNAESIFFALEDASGDRKPLWPAASDVTAEFSLAGMRARWRLADEDAKLNLNAVHARQRDSVREAITQHAAGQLVPQLRPDLSREAGVRKRWYTSWGQIFDVPQALSQRRSDALLAVTAELTCWGDGKPNVRRASDQAIETALTPVAGPEAARKLLAARHDFRGDLLLADLLAKLDLRRTDQVKMRSALSDRSSCYSLWIELEQGPRSWYYLAVVGDRGVVGPSQVLTFVW